MNKKIREKLANNTYITETKKGPRNYHNFLKRGGQGEREKIAIIKSSFLPQPFQKQNRETNRA